MGDMALSVVVNCGGYMWNCDNTCQTPTSVTENDRYILYDIVTYRKSVKITNIKPTVYTVGANS